MSWRSNSSDRSAADLSEHPPLPASRCLLHFTLTNPASSCPSRGFVFPCPRQDLSAQAVSREAVSAVVAKLEAAAARGQSSKMAKMVRVDRQRCDDCADF